MNPGAYDIAKRESEGALLLTYRLREESDDQRLPALYAFAFGKSGHVQLAAYFDSIEDQSIVEAVVQSLAELDAD